MSIAQPGLPSPEAQAPRRARRSPPERRHEARARVARRSSVSSVLRGVSTMRRPSGSVPASAPSRRRCMPPAIRVRGTVSASSTSIHGGHGNEAKYSADSCISASVIACARTDHQIGVGFAWIQAVAQSILEVAKLLDDSTRSGAPRRRRSLAGRGRLDNEEPAGPNRPAKPDRDDRRHARVVARKPVRRA